MRKLRFSFVNGSTEQLTLHEMLWFFRDGRTVAGFAAAGAAVILIEPFAELSVLGAAEQVVFWGLVMPGGFGLYLAVVLALAHHRGAVRTLTGHLMSAALLGLLSPPLAVWLGMDPAHAQWRDCLLVAAFALIWSTGIEFLMVTYLLPRYLAALESRSRPAGDALAGLATDFADTRGLAGEGPEVVLLGRSFALPDLRAITADEHYVHIRTLTGKTMLRGRISDIDAQLPDAWGRRVHRSHWVAARAVRALHRDRFAWTLELETGERVPVARARQDEVRRWVAGLGLPGA